jgi:hypothetical protein
MKEDFFNQQLDNLKNGLISEFFVSKEDFLIFRQILVKRPDFKHFRGIAKREGAVTYQYIEIPRS